jgi:hypothetical protein
MKWVASCWVLPSIALLATTVLADDAREMRAVSKNSLALSGAEYWPYLGDKAFRYPDDVLWGFYPEAGVSPGAGEEPNPASATAAAIECATTAYRKLVAFFEDHPATLDRILELGASKGITSKFYLWTNDYSRASNPYPYPMRTHRLWYWKRSPQVAGRVAGYWKWESTLTQDGRCLTPEPGQIREYLESKLTELEAARR